MTGHWFTDFEYDHWKWLLIILIIQYSKYCRTVGLNAVDQ